MSTDARLPTRQSVNLPRALSIGDKAMGIILVALATLLPFQFEHGLRIRGLLFTPWEGLLLVFVLLFFARRVWAGFRGLTSQPDGRQRTEIDRDWRISAVTASLFIAALAASALTSPAHLADVAKPVFRLGTVLLLFYITWFELQERPVLRRPVVSALVGGTFIAAGLGMAENTLGLDLEPILSLFRVEPTLHQSAPRLTGPFQHANEAAAAIALALILLWTVFWTPSRPSSQNAKSRAMVLCFALVSLLLAVGLVFTLSRAGIVSGLGGWFVLSLLGAQLIAPGNRTQSLLVGVLIPGLAISVSLLFSSAVRDRALGPPSNPYSVEYAVPEWTRAQAGEDLYLPVEVTNLGARSWSSKSSRPVHLAYHLADENGEMVDFEGPRSRFANTVSAGQTARIDAHIQVPVVPGEYTVIWDLVHEEVTWFSQVGNPGAITAISVLPALIAKSDTIVSTRKPVLPASALEFAPWDQPETVPRRTLWGIALGFWREEPWLGIGPGQFRHRFPERLPSGRYDPTLHANNLFLELGATTGGIGLGSYLIWIGTLISILVLRLQRRNERSARLWALGGLGLLSVYLAHGLLDSFLEPWAVQGLLAIGLGATLSESKTQACGEERET